MFPLRRAGYNRGSESNVPFANHPPGAITQGKMTMAKVKLGRREAEDGDLPPVCMRCGAVATEWKTKKFSWYPPWVSLLALLALLPDVVHVAMPASDEVIRSTFSDRQSNTIRCAR